MSTTPARTISILIPAYNAQRELGATLGSVLQQMAPHHALVVVDDGSTDGTAALVEQARAPHPAADITLIRQPNQGVAASRNRLLAAAAGEYVLFVDADDLLLPGSLGALDAAIAAHRPDAIACDFNFWHPQHMRRNRRVSLGYPPEALLRERAQILSTYLADRHTYLWAYVMRRELYARLPQPVFPAGRVFEDLSVLARLLAQCDSLYRLARPTIDYRQSAHSSTRSVSRSWCLDYAYGLRDAAEVFRQTPACDALRLQADVCGCHFYLGMVKESYQLGWREGQAARAEAGPIFLGSLFHDIDTVLAAMEAGSVSSHDHAADAAAARQLRKALSGSLAFNLGKTASRKIKSWQRMIAA